MKTGITHISRRRYRMYGREAPSGTACLWNSLAEAVSREECKVREDNLWQVNLTSKDSLGVDLHIDGNNYGPSDIVLLGSFSGGGFFLEEASGSNSVERDLVCVSGIRSSAHTRTPGIYKGQLKVPPCGSFTRFDGSVQLHRGEPVSEGIRFSLVWFSPSPRCRAWRTTRHIIQGWESGAASIYYISSCMYIYIYIYIYKKINIYVLHLHIISLLAAIPPKLFTHIYIYIYILYIYINMLTYAYTCLHTYIQIYTNIYIYIYIYITYTIYAQPFR